MFQNPKTTIAGILIILGSLATVLAHVFAGQGISSADIASFITALSGAGLIGARDGQS